MTAAEIEKRFKAGEIATETFGSKRNYYEIGDTRITQKQFSIIKLMPHDFKMEVGGWTKHRYKYAAP